MWNCSDKAEKPAVFAAENVFRLGREAKAMSVGQGDLFRAERVAALTPYRIERGSPAANSQERERRQQSGTDESKDETDEAPQDIIEWSAALQETPPAASVPTASARPTLPAAEPNPEARHLDVTV